MKPFVTAILFFLLGLAWVPAGHADENTDIQAALEKNQKGQYSQAVIAFQNIIENHPDSWKAYEGLGDAFLHEGDKDGALQAYQRSLQLHSDNPTVKAMVDKLSAEPPPPLKATPTPASNPTPGAAETDGKIHTIGTFSDQSGHKNTSKFIFEGKPLENDQQLEDVIDLLKDDQATHFMKSARGQQTAANALDVLGGLCVGAALVYGVAAPGTPVTNYFGGVSTGNPDLTPSYVLGGIGAGLLIIGLPVDEGANQNRSKAVARYNELAKPGSNPEAADKGTDEVAPVASEPTGEISKTAPPPGASGEPAGQGVSQTGFGISPLLNFPLSSKTGSEYTPGFGFALDFKLPLDRNWSIGLAATYQDLPVNKTFLAQSFQQTYGVPIPPGVSFSGDWYYFPVVALVQYAFPVEKSPMVPYVFAGAGVAFNSANASATYNNQTVTATVTEDDFLVCPGAGLKAKLDEKVEVFLQARLDINFTSQNNSDVIHLAGPGGSANANGNLSDDGPTLFMPIQLGLGF